MTNSETRVALDFKNNEERAQVHTVEKVPFWRMIIFPNSPLFLYGELCFTFDLLTATLELGRLVPGMRHPRHYIPS